LLNIYHSVKKGISVVINGKSNNPLKPVLERCITPVMSIDSVPQHNWEHWVGSDECGKGDYFGPLIVCGFYLDKKDLSTIKKIGVCDSKKLKQEQIIAIAKELYKQFNDNIECLILKPTKYNELYANFVAQHKNLNDLMAWAHSKVLDNLIKKHQKIEGVFIDQFSPSKKASQMLRKLHPQMQIIERPDGEQDYAVAAASIIARYQLLQTFQTMSRFYKMQFKMGAGAGVKTTAQSFIKQYGKNRLGEVLKLHFKTTKEL
jgi:ribonuclease HIII